MKNTINSNNSKQKIRSALAGTTSKIKSPKPGFKLNPRVIFSSLLVVMLIIGGAAGLYLTKINQDIRQQASEVYSCPAGSSNYGTTTKCATACASDCVGPNSQCCTITPTTAPTPTAGPVICPAGSSNYGTTTKCATACASDCVGPNSQCCAVAPTAGPVICPAGSSNYGTTTKCATACASDCVGPNLQCCSGIGGNPTPTPTKTPADCTAEGNPWGTCSDECKGVTQSTSCQRAYNKWTCANKGWIPDYENGACGGCPWNLTDGQCCPTGRDACDVLGSIVCIEDPYASVCEVWDSRCPAGQQNYYRAYDWDPSFEVIEGRNDCGYVPSITPTPRTTTPTPPGSTPTPPGTTPTPTTPIGPQCFEITAFNTTGGGSVPLTGNEDDNLILGTSTVRFVCAANNTLPTGYSYKFKIWEPCATDAVELDAIGNGVNYSIDLAGDYGAQCAVCDDSTDICDWEAYTPAACDE